MTRIFRIKRSRFVFFLIFTCLLCAVPAKSIWELASTGSIDMEAVVGSGSRATYQWKNYIGAWISAILGIWGFCIEVLWNYLTGKEVRISGNEIIIVNRIIKLDEISGVSFTGWKSSIFLKNYIVLTLRSGEKFALPRVFDKLSSDEIRNFLSSYVASELR